MMSSNAYNKIKFISSFQNGFYSMCIRERPEDPVVFVIDSLTNLFYCTNNISKMNTDVDYKYMELIDKLQSKNSSIVKVLDFSNQRKFIYTIINHSGFSDYDEGLAGTYKLTCEQSSADILTHIHHEDCQKITDDDITTLYVSLTGRNYDNVYFPIDVTYYQASMNMYQFSKMISFAAMFTLSMLDIFLSIPMMGVDLTNDFFYKSIFQAQCVHDYNVEILNEFYGMIHNNDKYIDTLIKKTLPKYRNNFSVHNNSEKSNTENTNKQEASDVLCFTTKDHQDNNDENCISSIIKRTKNGTTNITAVGMLDSDNMNILDIIKAVKDMIDKGDEADDQQDKGMNNECDDNISPFENIIRFIEFLDSEAEGTIDIPVSEAKCISKAIHKYLNTPRYLRETKSGTDVIQDIYSSGDVNMIFKFSKSDTDRIIFVAYNTGNDFELQKVLMPDRLRITQNDTPGIGIALNGAGIYVPFGDTSLGNILLGIEDVYDFHDDCLRIIAAWLGSYITKHNNIVNPYLNNKNNIILTDTTFSSIVNAFESINCFNNEKEIDALIKFINGTKTDFICPWMKDIESVGPHPIVVDKDGQYYGYDKIGYKFAKLNLKDKQPSSPFFTDLSWQIIKGGNSITLKGQYLSTDAFEKDIVSVLNYLKILKRN